MALPSEVKLELKKGANKMAPLIIAGVRIAAPVAAKYLAGKISRQAAIKASKELAKKPAKSILQKGKEITDKTGITGKKGRYKEARGKDGALVGTGKELAKDAGRFYVGDKAFDASLDAINRMKKGGMVKKCRMDGIALRGKTRAKERSK